MGVLLQAFYWDCPREAGVEFGWWRHVSARLDGLRSVGFTALWLPPCSKAMNARSMGYDPFDFFDLGEFDQRGAVATWFGTKAELVGLIGAAHARGMQVYADAVYNHMSGGELERNPDFDLDGWTRFQPASGRFHFDYRSFHPSLFQRRDDLAYGGMPDLCHRNPDVYAALIARDMPGRPIRLQSLLSSAASIGGGCGNAIPRFSDDCGHDRRCRADASCGGLVSCDLRW